MAREPAPIDALRRALGEQLATFRKAADLTQEQVARATFLDRTTISHIERGSARADERFWQTVDGLTNASGTLIAAFYRVGEAKHEHDSRSREAELAATRVKVESLSAVSFSPPTLEQQSDELAALELARRVMASDVGDETLTQLELVFDDLAMLYSRTPPVVLLPRVREQLSYVSSLMDGRKTLAEHQRLIVLGGWLSLLAATVHIDLKQDSAASARLRTAASLAQHAGHDEIRAWCYETEAWRLLTSGDHRKAVELSQAAQRLAPTGSSVAIQATAQEGRAWARLGQQHETYQVIEHVERLVSPISRPDRPEHHYRYDPEKSIAYMATTLAWVGDPAAEGYAREVIARLKPAGQDGKWPRRVASANLDLSLALLAADRFDEACESASKAISSGSVVPSNHWRAAEVLSEIERRQLPESKDLREAYEAMIQKSRD